jgi:hemoglobin
LGGRDAIVAVVNSFVDRIGGDETLNQRFANTELPRFKQLLVEQICEASGGPCKYTGRDMKTTHKGMNIREEEWNATVAHLVATLNEFKVGEPEQRELISAIAPMKGDVVGQ